MNRPLNSIGIFSHALLYKVPSQEYQGNKFSQTGNSSAVSMTDGDDVSRLTDCFLLPIGQCSYPLFRGVEGTGTTMTDGQAVFRLASTDRDEVALLFSAAFPTFNLEAV